MHPSHLKHIAEWWTRFYSHSAHSSSDLNKVAIQWLLCAVRSRYGGCRVVFPLSLDNNMCISRVNILCSACYRNPEYRMIYRRLRICTRETNRRRWALITTLLSPLLTLYPILIRWKAHLSWYFENLPVACSEKMVVNKCWSLTFQVVSDTINEAEENDQVVFTPDLWSLISLF